MAGPWYVSSVNGNDANSGLTKALAKATVDGASGLLSTAFAAGETVRIDSAHSETWAADRTLAWPGTQNNPVNIISIDWTPDTYLKATTRQIYTTGATNDINWNGAAKSYGLFLEVGGDLNATAALGSHLFENSTIKLALVASRFRTGNSSGSSVELVDTEIDIISTSIPIRFTASANFTWRNGPNNNSKITSAGNETQVFIFDGFNYSQINLLGVDLTQVGPSTSLFSGSNLTHSDINLVNCSLPASLTILSTVSNFARNGLNLVNCDDGTGNNLYRTERHDYFGTTVVTDADYNNDGASDGANSISWKMVSNTNALEFYRLHASLWISGWVDSTGTKTFTIETNSENVTFEDDELWMELEFLGAAGDTQSDMLTSRAINSDSTPVNVPDSTDNPSWTTPNISIEKKQKLSVTATVGRVGPFRARVCLAKPSSTVWIDPLVRVTQ